MNKKHKKIILLSFLFVIIFVLSAFFITSLARGRTYKCYYYYENINNENYNVLENYEYFNLTLNRDGTFVISFATKEYPDLKETIKGNYTKTNKTLSLCFGASHPEFIAFDCLEFTRSGTKLLCTQSAPLGTLTVTVFLRFKRVLF